MNAVHSELHNRLGKMVHYSSQLIFVSSESIAQQQRTLESFLAEQSEGTEVAFIVAKPEYDVRQYRRQLCQQLLGQVAGSYIRPLNELLESLNHHDGPVLIGIMQSQLLPNEFLQELWQLVLQSRFAANKQHLNIVLFGESQWAAQAQQWLPAKNTATPVLMSSETIMNQTSELDALIAQKRAAFQQRIAAREEPGLDDSETKPLVKSPLFSLLIIGIFISVFSGILWTQYPEKMRSLVGLSETVTGSETVQSAPEIETAPIATAPLHSEQTVQTEEISLVLKEDQSVTDLLLVQQWVEPSVDAPVEATTTSETDTPEPVIETPPASGIDTTPTTDVIDDLPASENLDGVITRLPDDIVDGFVVQLTGVKTLSLLTEFVADNSLNASVWYYKTNRYGGDWFVLVASSTYPTLDEARASIAQLPNYNRLSEPFVKSIAQIKREISTE